MAKKSIEPQDLLWGLLPGKLHHYSFKFNRDSTMSVLMQVDMRGGESAYHGFLRTAASIMRTTKIAKVLYRGCGGIAKRIDDLAELLSKAS